MLRTVTDFVSARRVLPSRNGSRAHKHRPHATQGSYFHYRLLVLRAQQPRWSTHETTSDRKNVGTNIRFLLFYRLDLCLLRQEEDFNRVHYKSVQDVRLTLA